MSNQNLSLRIAKNASWLVADLMMLAAYLLFQPRLNAFFIEKSFFQSTVIIMVYLIFCVSVLLIRKLQGENTQKSELNRGWLSFFAVFFGVFIMYMIAESSGFFAKLDNLPNTIDAWASLLLIVIVILALLLAFLYFTAIQIKVKPFTSKSHSSLFLTEFLGILGANLMIIITTAFWNASFNDIEAYEGLTIGAKILIFLLTYLFFLLFFAPPRMLFLLKKSNNYAWLTFFAQTTYFVWDSLSRFAW